ncbi:MAG: hypothetical protein EB084_02150 [Proteobacteria bacterium]|nr:hypothetical protein [Pseudomonadota bacterium]
MTWQVKLDVFEGPLDLLLYLVTKDQLDITEISLAKVADEYFAHLKALQEAAVEARAAGFDLDVESGYLVVFACLLEMKSRLLLPPEPDADLPDGFDLERDTEEHDLVERLKEYKRFKEASNQLQDRERQSLQMFARPVTEEEEVEVDVNAGLEVSLPDLLDALRRMLETNQRRKKSSRGLRLQRVAVSVPQRMKEMLASLAEICADGRPIEFVALFEGDVSRPHVIVTFLAMLELARLRRIRIAQEPGVDGRRGPIIVELIDGSPLVGSLEVPAERSPSGKSRE